MSTETTAEQARRDAMADARRAAVKAVLTTGISRGDTLTEMPQCHAKRCWCGGGEEALSSLVGLVLLTASREVERALLLEEDEDVARLVHQRDAWDEGYMHAMRHGDNTRGENPYWDETEAALSAEVSR